MVITIFIKVKIYDIEIDSVTDLQIFTLHYYKQPKPTLILAKMIDIPIIK
jgi:hypothetical protein